MVVVVASEVKAEDEEEEEGGLLAIETIGQVDCIAHRFVPELLEDSLNGFVCIILLWWTGVGLWWGGVEWGGFLKS